MQCAARGNGLHHNVLCQSAADCIRSSSFHFCVVLIFYSGIYIMFWIYSTWWVQLWESLCGSPFLISWYCLIWLVFNPLKFQTHSELRVLISSSDIQQAPLDAYQWAGGLSTRRKVPLVSTRCQPTEREREGCWKWERKRGHIKAQMLLKNKRLTRVSWCDPGVAVWCFISSVWVQFSWNVSNHHSPVVGSRTMLQAWKHRILTKPTRHWRVTTIMATNVYNMYII